MDITNNFITLVDIYNEFDDFIDKENFVKMCGIPQLYDMFIEDSKKKMREGVLDISLLKLIEDNEHNESLIMLMMNNFRYSLNVGYTRHVAKNYSYSDSDEHEYNETALILACNLGMENLAIKIIDLYRDSCKINECYEDETVFVLAMGEKMDRLVHKIYKDYNSILLIEPIEYSNSILHSTIRLGYTDIAMDMIKEYPSRCYPTYANCYNITSFMSCCQYGHSDLAILMIDTFGFDILPSLANGYEKEKYNSLMYACENNLFYVVKKLIDTFELDSGLEHSCNDIKLNAFEIACSRGQYEIVCYLIETVGHVFKLNKDTINKSFRLACTNNHFNIAFKLVESFFKPNYNNDIYENRLEYVRHLMDSIRD